MLLERYLPILERFCWLGYIYLVLDLLIDLFIDWLFPLTTSTELNEEQKKDRQSLFAGECHNDSGHESDEVHGGGNSTDRLPHCLALALGSHEEHRARHCRDISKRIKHDESLQNNHHHHHNKINKLVRQSVHGNMYTTQQRAAPMSYWILMNEYFN
jgi:hypothetical protein